MPEHSHDPAEDGFHEIQLSGKQLVFLFMTATIVSVFIFLCGVLVGRGARDARIGEPVQAAAGPAPTDTPAPVGATDPPATEPPSPAETPDELSYHASLQGRGTPADKLKTPPSSPPAAAAEPREQQPSAPAAVADDVPTSGQPGTHVVQVFASQDRSVAAALVRKLAGKGYPAFLVSTRSPGAPQMFKVQVGRYDEREAEQVSRRIEKEEKFKPWISR